MNEKDEIQEFSLEDIMREFGAELEDLSKEAPQNAVPAPEPGEKEDTPEEKTEPETQPEAETAEEELKPVTEPEVVPEETAPKSSGVTGDTVRLDMLPHHLREQAQPVEEEEEEPVLPEPEKEETEPFSEEWEPEYEEPIGEYKPPEPIIFRPKSRLQEMKRKLIAGPEKRYYELVEMGLGKLQMAILLNVLLVLVGAASTALYAFGAVQPERLKLLIYFQVFVMLLSALLGSYRLMDGVADLGKGHFTLNTLMFVTFLACCADGVLCLIYEKVPCCAAFGLEMVMCLWATYERRSAQMGQMDTLRKATHLEGITAVEDFFEGRPGFLRCEGDVDDFMDHYDQVSGPEKALSTYAVLVLIAAVAIGVVAGMFHSWVLGVRAFAAALLASMPATIFVTLSRPAVLLQQRLHKLGTVLCGWKGVRSLGAAGVFPLNDTDLFPLGTIKMNGVKFYGDRDPDDVVAYATALITADDGGLAPVFNQLLDSRNGRHYEVENLRAYGDGGIGGEVCGEPVLVGLLPFLQDMGVEIPDGTRVNQAVYVAIDGVFCGLFAITYGKNKSSTAGFNTLCSYRGLTPVLTTGDFMLTESFLRSKFNVATNRVAFPKRKDRAVLAAKQPEADAPAMALTTMDGLAPAAYAVTGARALRSACHAGVVVHIIGGILGLVMMMALAILGAEELLTPGNLFLYELIWMIPGLLITEWTRSV